ncbi:MAG: hydrolase [Alphaproteobacteria bacterium]|nr:hydrolase [Alphaproteobacteria bacterium]
MADTLLDIVNGNDEIIGQALRSEIHAKGLLHREIHVWFITPDKQVIFQKRSMKKETNPGLLTTAVGGHVELGASYDETALVETMEETGRQVKAEDMIRLGKFYSESFHPKTNVHNRALRALYGVVFKGDINELRIEQGDAEGFIALAFSDLSPPSKDLKKQMSPKLLEEEFPLIKEALKNLVS